MPLDVLARDYSVELLRKHRPDLREDDPYLKGIALELGDLPLALHLAGRFLARYQRTAFATPVNYLAELRRPNLLAHRSLTIGGHSPTGHEQHVARTIELSYRQLEPETPSTAGL